MTCVAITSSDPCPCGTPEFPVQICNAPNQPAIVYRVGDYLAFRTKLLHQLPGETQLTAWQPGATGDLAVQLIEWWAYLADILTFYNERIANEAYLGTALMPESVNHLVQILGYRPRPALGAKVTLAGLLTPGARVPVSLPQGLQVQSKPGPGLPPQIFELASAATLNSPDILSADVVPSVLPLFGSPTAPAASNLLWLTGKITGIKAGDRLLLINNQALASAPSIANYAWISVVNTQAAKDPLGNAITALNFSTLTSSIPATAAAGDYVLLRSSQSSPLWTYPTSTPTISTTIGRIIGDEPDSKAHSDVFGVHPIRYPSFSTINLASLSRSLTTGSLFLLDVPGSTALTPAALLVESYAEQFWYANCGAGVASTTAPANNTPPAVGMLISTITTSALTGDWNANVANVTLRFAFTAVGALAPVLNTADLTFPTGGTTLTPATAGTVFPNAITSVLLEDASGSASAATLTPDSATTAAVTLMPATPPQPTLTLVSPIDVMFNQLPFSRGKTVPTEALGSGNPLVAGQDFTLQNSPVTYFADPASISGDGYSSTVQVSVNNVLWHEAQSFFNQPATAQIFVLREDDQGHTHVTFGDGTNGALLATGTNNVVASYRYGAGAAVPAAETLTVVQTPQPGLKSIRNPLQPTGGSDADSPARLRSLAPQSVLTFNRAVSLDDYAAIALTGAGVTQAVAGYAFDPISQRPTVTLWVAGDSGATLAATQALAGTAMPGQGLNILTANARPMMLSLTFLCDSNLDAPAIQAALTVALTDADLGLFGSNVIGIGEVIYDSQIEAACLGVAGVQAVHNLDFGMAYRLEPRIPVGLFRLRRPGFLPVPRGCAGRRNDPGAGYFYSIASLVLNPSVAATI